MVSLLTTFHLLAVATFGFEQMEYFVGETVGFIEVCARLLDPEELAPGSAVFGVLVTVDGTAKGSVHVHATFAVYKQK